jgi:hypothetical protein
MLQLSSFKFHHFVVLLATADICIVLGRKVRFKVYFWLCIHLVQGWPDLSTSLKRASGGKSLEKWFEVIHKDIVTYIHCFSSIFAISHL